jgi:hypothetical protein
MLFRTTTALLALLTAARLTLAADSSGLPAPTNLYDGFLDLGAKLGGTAKARLFWKTSTKTGDIQPVFRYALVFPVEKWLAFGPNFSPDGRGDLADLTIAFSNPQGTAEFSDSVARYPLNNTDELPPFFDSFATCRNLTQSSISAICSDAEACRTWANGTCTALCTRSMLTEGFQKSVAPAYGSGTYQIHEFSRTMTATESLCDVSITPAIEQTFTVGFGSFRNSTYALSEAVWESSTTFLLKMEKPTRTVSVPVDADSKHTTVDRVGVNAGIICGLLFGLIIVSALIAGGLEVAINGS